MATLETKEHALAPTFPTFNGGSLTKKVFGTVDKTAEVADADLAIIGRGIIPNNVILKAWATSGAITGSTDWDLVVVDEDGTVLVTLAAAVSFATAKSADILAAASKGKSIAQLAGKGVDQLLGAYDIALLGNTVGAGTGTIQIELEYSAPQ